MTQTMLPTVRRLGASRWLVSPPRESRPCAAEDLRDALLDVIDRGAVTAIVELHPGTRLAPAAVDVLRAASDSLTARGGGLRLVLHDDDAGVCLVGSVEDLAGRGSTEASVLVPSAPQGDAR